MKINELLEAVKEKKFRFENSEPSKYSAAQFELKGGMPAEVKKHVKELNFDYFTEDGFTTINVENKMRSKFKNILKDLGYTEVKTW